MLKILSLGAGVQSSALYLAAVNGDIEKHDYAIFADTGAEPKNVYEWLHKLKQIGDHVLPIIEVSAGNIESDMRDTEKTFYASPPFFTIDETGKKGIVMRHCTLDYKIKPINKKIRELLGYKFRERYKIEKTARVTIGISKDEAQRVRESRDKYIVNYYPLVPIAFGGAGEFVMNRQDCIDYVVRQVGSTPPRSACFFCPFKSNKEWKLMSDAEMERAILFDEEIRNLRYIHPRYAKSKASKVQLFIHPSRKPLREVEFQKSSEQSMVMECLGMCGN